MPTTFDQLFDLWTSLGSRLRIARERRGWSQQDLARRMQVARNTLIRLEAGDPSVRLETLGAALRALDLDLQPVEDLADPAKDKLGLAIAIAQSRRGKPPEDPRDAYDFGHG